MKRVTELTDDELNRVIAKNQGWRLEVDHTEEDAEWYWVSPVHPDGSVEFDVVPDYCNDLNAMHEAEKSLENSQVFDYMKNLVAIKKHPKSEMGQLHTYLFHATARQRAEAYAITKKLAL